MRCYNIFFKKKNNDKGKVSVLDWVEVRQLAQQGKMVESLRLLLKRAYNLSDEKIDRLSKEEVSKLMNNIEGVQDNLKCQNCGGVVEKLLCEKCVTFEANRKQIADEFLKAATGVIQDVKPAN